MIRVSQWAEICQMHLTDHVPKKQIARRPSPTSRRCAAPWSARRRASGGNPRRGAAGSTRERIEAWLRGGSEADGKAHRTPSGTVLRPTAGALAAEVEQDRASGKFPYSSGARESRKQDAGAHEISKQALGAGNRESA